MSKIISFIDFTNMSDEEKYKLLNSKDYEIERLNNIINELEKRLEQAIEELENIPINANGGDILESERKVYHILKGSE